MPAPTEFEWDEVKDEANRLKHGIGFAESIAVFLDPDLILLDASREEDGEARSKAIGTIEGRVFTLVFTMRAGVCRMISARAANKREREVFTWRP